MGRSTTEAAYEKHLGRDPKGRPLRVAMSGSRDLPLMKYSIYHPEGEVDPRGAVAEYPAYKGQTQMLTYWEERNPGTPSRQQRWYQWMSNQDAGPMVGALGAGWDGVDRAHMFAGEPAVLDPADPRYGELSPVARFPENQAAQEWIYRDAPEEIERPYQVDAVEEPTMEFFAPEVAAVQKAMAQGGAGKLKAAQYRQQQSASQEAARSAGQHSSYGYAGNGGTTYGDKAAQWEDPIGEIPVLPRSKTVHSVVQTSLNKSQQLSLQQRRAHAPRHKGDSMPPFPIPLPPPDGGHVRAPRQHRAARRHPVVRK